MSYIFYDNIFRYLFFVSVIPFVFFGTQLLFLLPSLQRCLAPCVHFCFCSYVLTCVVFILFFHISLFDVRGYVWDGVCHVLLFEVNARGQRSN